MKRLTVIILLVLAAVPVLAQDVSRQKEQKKQIEQEIALIDKQLDANTSKRKKSLNTLILTRRKLEARKKLIAQLDKDIAGYDRDIGIHHILHRESGLNRIYRRIGISRQDRLQLTI